MQKQLQRTASAHVRRLERAYVEEERTADQGNPHQELRWKRHQQLPRHTKTIKKITWRITWDELTIYHPGDNSYWTIPKASK